MTLCSVIIPVHNRASLTRQCLNTLLANPPANVELEIIVVDDYSTDDTPALLARYGQRIRGVTHPTNTGFAISCNDGAAMAQGEYLVFLNNDTIPQPGWLDALVAHAERHPNAAVVGSKLVFPNGTIQHAGVAICQDRNPRHIYAGFPADHPAVNKSRRFQIVTGACMLVRRALFEQIDGFDTAFLNGHEDVDLCLRLGQLGYEVHYCHESVLTHLESVSRGHLTQQALANGRLYSKRWHGRVVPDDLRYYAEDGLITVGYPSVYPVNIGIAPQLANIASDERNRSADQLLMARSRQVLDLLRDNISLNVRVQEAEYQATTRARLEPNRSSCAAEPIRPVSVIIPVFNAFDHLVSTLDSLKARTDLDVHSVVIIDDASTDERVRDHLEGFARQTPFATSLLRNEQNEGFPRSVNRAIHQSTGDVVLLNSDTVVTCGWLEKLQRAAYSQPKIASVTPFSNNATICSIPRFLERNVVPEGFTIETFAQLIEKISLRVYPELPTAVGFCMYITREALDAVGLFDEERFGRGYGEENDWCMRALKAGFVNILDDATYVYHHGSASFTLEAQQEFEQANLKVMDQIHPHYMPMVREFCLTNPLRPLHEYIALGMQLVHSHRRARP